MRIYFRNGLLLLVSACLHVAIVLVIAAALTEPEIGKNIPVLIYPVRVRVVEANLTQTDALAIAQRTKPAINPLPPSAAAAPTLTAGRIERSPKIYIESSARYFPPAELDNRPTIVAAPDLETTDISPMTEGEAILRLFINESGHVDRMDIQQSTLPEVMLEKLQSLRDQISFTPGNKNGLDVKSVISYRIELAKDPTVTIIHRSDGLAQ